MMKRLIIILFLSLLQIAANAQNTNIFVAYINTEEALVQGVLNPVKIITDADSIKIDNGKLIYNTDSTYSILPYTDNVCILNFWKDGEVKHEEKFRAIAFPISKVAFNNYTSGSYIPLALIKVVPGLHTIPPDIPFIACTDALNSKIVSFDFITLAAGNMVRIACNGPVFNKEIQDILQKTKSGQILLFTNIIAETPVGRRTLDGIFIEAR